MNLKISVMVLILPLFVFAQNDGFDKALKAGEILVNGLAVIKNGKSQDKSPTTVESFCVSNKLREKIIFKLSADTQEEKELIVPKNGKECLYNLNRAVWKYSVLLTNGEIYKKGEYNIEDSETILLKE